MLNAQTFGEFVWAVHDFGLINSKNYFSALVSVSDFFQDIFSCPVQVPFKIDSLWLTQARGGGLLPLGLILWNFTTAFLRQPTHVMKYYLLPKYSNMSNKPATRFKHLWFRAHWFCKGIFLNNIVFCACLITFSLKTAVSPPVLEYRIRNTEYRTEYRIQNIEYRIRNTDFYSMT